MDDSTAAAERYRHDGFRPDGTTRGAGAHVVQFYDDDAFLADMVCGYIAAGLAAGDPIVIIATPAHLEAFEARLSRRAIDVERAVRTRLLTFLDAGETLAALMRGRMPDAEKFRAHVGGVLRKARAAANERPARAYGEMVDVLWKAGNREAAIRLEELWNELARDEAFTLICAYGMASFDGERTSGFHNVCDAHSHVLPTESFSSLESEPTRLREVALLQQRARALEAEIEHRKALESELREREAELRDFLENALEGIHWVGPDGTILFANKAELELLGYAKDDYVGHHIADFHADQDAIQDILARLYGGQSITNYEARLRCKDGSIKDVLINSNVLFRDGKFVHTRCFTRDITARKRSEDALRFLAEATSTLSSSLDYEGTLTAVARLAVPRIADWAAVDVLERDSAIRRLAVEGDPAGLADPHAVQNVVRTGRSELLQSSICVALRARGGIVGALTIGSAGSGRRYTEEDLRLLEDLARRAGTSIENAIYYRAAEAASQAKDEFLAIVSHELRTPLNAILGWVHMLQQGGLGEERSARALETIERNARAQNQLIEDLLDVSRIVSGKLRLDVESVDLPEVIRRTIDSLRPAVTAKSIRVRLTIDPGAGPVMGDPNRLQQVVWNLVNNAVKFSPKGSSVHVVLRKRDSSVEIIVRDEGQGIDRAFLPHIFERFRQADTRTDRSQRGLGLGLAIVRNLVELHGGTVRAESEGPGSGATFTVALPISPLRSASFDRPPALQLTAARSAKLECPPQLEGLHVLVVDDEEDARDLLAALLARCKIRVSTARSAAEAIQMVQDLSPDMVVSDIGMPGEDGYAFIKQLRALPAEKGGRTPTVALTAYARTEERTKALVCGFNMHVPKPVEPAELLAVLGSFVSVLEPRDPRLGIGGRSVAH
jgi:PAS domain S-box-containing protein